MSDRAINDILTAYNEYRANYDEHDSQFHKNYDKIAFAEKVMEILAKENDNE